MVVALIALIAALAGTAYAAGKLNGKTIVNKSIAGNKLKNNTVTGKQVKESTLKGVTAASVGSVTYVTAKTVPIVSPQPDAGTPATATCPAGTKVIGGGAQVSSEHNDYVNDSFPTTARTGWTATIFGATGDTGTVTAICTAVTASTG